MSSIPSSSALSRTRSLRKPTNSETGSAVSSDTRNVSPSKLPVKGQLPGTSSAPTATRSSRSATASTGTAKSTRPLSGVFARITSSSTRSRNADSPTPETSPPGRLTRAATVRQSSTSTRPATSGGGATVAGPRPTTSSGVPTARRVASTASVGQAPADKAPPGPRHARTRSSVMTLSSATTLRPPSQSSTGSSSTTATAAASPGPNRSRPPLSSLTRRPPAGGAAPAPPSPTIASTPRRRSSVPSSSSSPSAPPPPPNNRPQQLNPPSSQLSTKPPLPTNISTSISTTTLLQKQPFKTHQQSYTPLKPPAPKQPTSHFLAPPSPSKQPANVALSAEMARLQAELLQLCLLHRGAGRVVGEWEGSARGKLGERFERVKRLEREVAGLEGEVEEGRNLGFLRVWGGGITGGGGGYDHDDDVDEGRGRGRGRERMMVMQSGFSSLDEKVAMLDDVVSGVWSVAGEPAGRYERVARECGEWVARAEGVLLRQKKRLQQQQQTSPTNDLDQDEAAAAAAAELELIPPLPPAWHEEAAHLARRLDDWRRKLRELGQLPSSSSTTGTPDKADGDGNGGTRPEQPSLARILAGCRALVHGMLAELDTMEQIQRDVAATEMLWVRDMNRHGLGGTDEGAARAGAIWRAL